VYKLKVVYDQQRAHSRHELVALIGIFHYQISSFSFVHLGGADGRRMTLTKTKTEKNRYHKT